VFLQGAGRSNMARSVPASLLACIGIGLALLDRTRSAPQIGRKNARSSACQPTRSSCRTWGTARSAAAADATALLNSKFIFAGRLRSTGLALDIPTQDPVHTGLPALTRRLEVPEYFRAIPNGDEQFPGWRLRTPANSAHRHHGIELRRRKRKSIRVGLRRRGNCPVFGNRRHDDRLALRHSGHSASPLGDWRGAS